MWDFHGVLDVTPCSLVKRCLRFRGICSLHPHGTKAAGSSETLVRARGLDIRLQCPLDSRNKPQPAKSDMMTCRHRLSATSAPGLSDSWENAFSRFLTHKSSDVG
jgi:hypothetical protein